MPIEQEGVLNVAISIPQIRATPTYYIPPLRDPEDEEDTEYEDEGVGGLGVQYFIRLAVFTDYDDVSQSASELPTFLTFLHRSTGFGILRSLYSTGLFSKETRSTILLLFLLPFLQRSPWQSHLVSMMGLSLKDKIWVKEFILMTCMSAGYRMRAKNPRLGLLLLRLQRSHDRTTRQKHYVYAQSP